MSQTEAIENAVRRLRLVAEIIVEADKPASRTWEQQQAKWGERLDGIVQELELALADKLHCKQSTRPA